VQLQLDNINMDTDKYTPVAVKYEQNAYLVPLIQLYSILHQKSLLLSLLSLKKETFEITKNKKAGEPILYKTNNNIK
jgi:hypothetical protein